MENNQSSAMLRRLNLAWENAKANGATQQEASIAMGYSNNSFLSGMLSGKKSVSIDNAFKLSIYLKLSPVDLFPELLTPYANAFAAMMSDVTSAEKDKDAVIFDLQKRLSDAGINAEVRSPMAVYNPLTDDQREVIELLTRLPMYETDFVLQSLRARVALHYSSGSSLTEVGNAAMDVCDAVNTTASEPVKLKET